MMVQKARLFGDEEVAKRMLATRDPKAHKALGREVRGFEPGVWDERMYSSLFTPPPSELVGGEKGGQDGCEPFADAVLLQINSAL